MTSTQKMKGTNRAKYAVAILAVTLLLLLGAVYFVFVYQPGQTGQPISCYSFPVLPLTKQDINHYLPRILSSPPNIDCCALGIIEENSRYFNSSENYTNLTKSVNNINRMLSRYNISTNDTTNSLITSAYYSCANGIYHNLINILGFIPAAKLNPDPPPNTYEGLLQSGNWAGYIVSSNFIKPGNVITEVRGSWKVQPVYYLPNQTYSAQWVGIGGVDFNKIYNSSKVNDGTLIQVGTESENYCNPSIKTCNLGYPLYYAWYELLYNTATPSNKIPNLPINPNDTISAQIFLVNSLTNTWNITINDISDGHANTVLVHYNSSKLSADFIEEDPGSPSLPFANFSTSYFGHQYTSVLNTDNLSLNNQSGNIADFPYVNVTMFSGNFNTVSAYAGPLTNAGTSFKAIYANYFTTPLLSLNQSSVIVGGKVSLNASTSGGTPPYTYNYIVINTNTDTVANYITSAISNISVAEPSVGTYNAFVLATDSASVPATLRSGNVTFTVVQSTTTSTSTTTTTIPYAPPAPAISPPSASVDQGQGLSFRAVDGSLNGINRALWQLWNGTAGTAVQGITTQANATAVDFTQVTPYYNTTYSVSVAYLNSTNATIANRTYSSPAGVTVYPRQ